MTPARAARVADFIRSELADIVLTKMRDPRISMLSVTDARVSRDLAFADIYVSSLTTADDDARQRLVAVLNRASGFLRSAIAQRHRMRTTPKLRFHYDELVEEGPRLEALIDDATASQSPRDFALRNRPVETPPESLDGGNTVPGPTDATAASQSPRDFALRNRPVETPPESLDGGNTVPGPTDATAARSPAELPPESLDGRDLVPRRRDCCAAAGIARSGGYGAWADRRERLAVALPLAQRDAEGEGRHGA